MGRALEDDDECFPRGKAPLAKPLAKSPAKLPTPRPAKPRKAAEASHAVTDGDRVLDGEGFVGDEGKKIKTPDKKGKAKIERGEGGAKDRKRAREEIAPVETEVSGERPKRYGEPGKKSDESKKAQARGEGKAVAEGKKNKRKKGAGGAVKQGVSVLEEWVEEEEDIGAQIALARAEEAAKKEAEEVKRRLGDKESMATSVKGFTAQDATPGMQLWGCVAEVTSSGLLISLPHGVFGFADVAEVSDQISGCLGKAERGEAVDWGQEDEEMKEEGEEEQEEGEEGEEGAGGESIKQKSPHARAAEWMARIFTQGQLVPCTVLPAAAAASAAAGAAGGSGAGAAAAGAGVAAALAEVAVSVRLSRVQGPVVRFKSVPAHTELWAAVESVEEHGLILSFGLRTITAFLPFTQFTQRFPGVTFRKGQLLPVPVVVEGRDKAHKTLTVSLEPTPATGKAAQAHTPAPPAVAAGGEGGEGEEEGGVAVLPGQLVQGKVLHVMQDGSMAVGLPTATAWVHPLNLPRPLLSRDQCLPSSPSLPRCVPFPPCSITSLPLRPIASLQVHPLNLPRPLLSLDQCLAIFPIGATVKARVLFCTHGASGTAAASSSSSNSAQGAADPKVVVPTIALSLSSSLLRATTPSIEWQASPSAPPTKVLPGSLFPAAVVERIYPGLGVLLRLGGGEKEKKEKGDEQGKQGKKQGAKERKKQLGKAAYALVHLRQLSASGAPAIPAHVAEGKQVCARVLHLCPSDGLAIASLKGMAVKTTLSPAGVQAGKLVTGTVVAVAAEGVRVQLAFEQWGWCPRAHMSEGRGTHRDDAAFNPGASLQFRVLRQGEGPEGPVLLTHKKTLVSSKLPVLTSPSQATAGVCTHGWVEALTKGTCTVHFYGDFSATIHREQEEQGGGKVTPWTSLHVGQVLRCFALPSADAAHPAFSLHSPSTPFSNHTTLFPPSSSPHATPPPRALPNALHAVGSVIPEAPVVRRDAHSLVLALPAANGVQEAVMAVEHLADQPGKSVVMCGGVASITAAGFKAGAAARAFPVAWPHAYRVCDRSEGRWGVQCAASRWHHGRLPALLPHPCCPRHSAPCPLSSLPIPSHSFIISLFHLTFSTVIWLTHPPLLPSPCAPVSPRLTLSHSLSRPPVYLQVPGVPASPSPAVFFSLGQTVRAKILKVGVLVLVLVCVTAPAGGSRPFPLRVDGPAVVPGMAVEGTTAGPITHSNSQPPSSPELPHALQASQPLQVALDPFLCASHDGSFASSLLQQERTAARLAEQQEQPWMGAVVPGMAVEGTVLVKHEGAMGAGGGGGGGGGERGGGRHGGDSWTVSLVSPDVLKGVTAVVPADLASKPLTLGERVSGRVVDVGGAAGHVVLAVGDIAAPQAKSGSAGQVVLAKGTRLLVRVLLSTPHYAVVALPACYTVPATTGQLQAATSAPLLATLAGGDFNLPHVDVPRLYLPGQIAAAALVALPSPQTGGRIVLARDELVSFTHPSSGPTATTAAAAAPPAASAAPAASSALTDRTPAATATATATAAAPTACTATSVWQRRYAQLRLLVAAVVQGEVHPATASSAELALVDLGGGVSAILRASQALLVAAVVQGEVHPATASSAGLALVDLGGGVSAILRASQVPCRSLHHLCSLHPLCPLFPPPFPPSSPPRPPTSTPPFPPPLPPPFPPPPYPPSSPSPSPSPLFPPFPPLFPPSPLWDIIKARVDKVLLSAAAAAAVQGKGQGGGQGQKQGKGKGKEELSEEERRVVEERGMCVLIKGAVVMVHGGGERVGEAVERTKGGKGERGEKGEKVEKGKKGERGGLEGGEAEKARGKVLDAMSDDEENDSAGDEEYEEDEEEEEEMEVDEEDEEDVSDEEKEGGNGDGGDAEEEDEDEEEVAPLPVAVRGAGLAGRKRLPAEEERAIQEAEQRRVKGQQAPETEAEFEQLLLASPNSSFLWIKFMAFLLSLSEIDKARAVAERALKSISYREEGEKLNIWVAYLNLENMHGNPPKEAVLALFQRGLAYTDPKKLHVALLGVFERSQQHDMADTLLHSMAKKFSTSAKVWLRYIQNQLSRGLEEGARKLLERALTVLPQRKHIKVISQAALMEYRIGSQERGRTLFENILRNFPKRTDLWITYIDQEVRMGDMAAVRRLFERVVSLDLPPKKMKSLLKKYLDFETAHGTQEQVAHVKARAVEYVQRRMGAGGHA
ncbi:unnamed protein product [Closterium sp. Naga37s-1]|nr:unnamed protein product [Closterium sp. Naga37s-1]